MSLSQNSSDGAPSHARRIAGRPLTSARISPKRSDDSRASVRPACQAHVLRAHSCGITCSGAASGPRLYAVMRSTMSSGATFAYSISMSK